MSWGAGWSPTGLWGGGCSYGAGAKGGIKNSLVPGRGQE